MGEPHAGSRGVSMYKVSFYCVNNEGDDDSYDVLRELTLYLETEFDANTYGKRIVNYFGDTFVDAALYHEVERVV